MHEDNFLFGTQVDISTTVTGRTANQGVTYQVPHIFVDYISVDANGIVSALLSPADGVMGVFVRVLDTTSGDLLDEVLLVIKTGADATPVVAIRAYSPGTVTIDDATPGVLFVTWSGLDITTPINGFTPTDLQLWDNTNNQQIVQIDPLASSGSDVVDVSSYPNPGTLSISLRVIAIH
jgi:hypothetical protein